MPYAVQTHYDIKLTNITYDKILINDICILIKRIRIV